MKNIFYALVICFAASTCFANDVCVGTCRQPVRNSVATVAGVTREVVRGAVVVATSPVRVVKNVGTNVRQRRVCRRCR